jgi:hypothetical protein
MVIQKSRGNLTKDRTTPQTSYSIPKVHKLGPRMELSRRDEPHSYDDENNSKGIQETLKGVFGGTLKTIPSKA